MSAGALAAEFSISRPAVSRHLRVLREAGLAVPAVHGRERVYSLRTEPLAELDAWLQDFLPDFSQKLDALETEVARTRRQRRVQPETTADEAPKRLKETA